MHSGDMNELGGVNLTDAEREALLEVMQRAKDFDSKAQKSMNSRLEGQLQKWTNALKGWQSRWLSVDQQQGVLHYYTSEDRKKFPPRGSLHLWGAVIAPSDEDSQTFSVNGANGEVYRLRGSDAKERQYWVSRLRNEVERCTSTYGRYSKTQVCVSDSTPTPQTHTSTTALSPLSLGTTVCSSERPETLSPTSSQHNTPTRKISKSKRGLSVFTSRSSTRKRSKDRKVDLAVDLEDGISALPGGEAMLEVLTRLQKYQDALCTQLESCSGTGMEPVDRNVLLLKATSQAAVHSVKDCLALIKLQQTSSTASAASSQPGNGNPSSQVVLSEEALVEKRLTGTGDGGRRPERPLSTPVLDLSGVPPPGAGEQSSPQPRPRANSSSQSTRSPVVTSV